MTPYDFRIARLHFVTLDRPVQIDRGAIGVAHVDAGFATNQVILQAFVQQGRILKILQDRICRFQPFAFHQDVAVAERSQRQITIDLVDERHVIVDMNVSKGDEMAPVTIAWRYVVVFALAILFLYLGNFRAGIFVWQLSQQEGGTHVDEAFQILHGQLIYRDFFEMLAPGIFYVDAFFLWLLGPTPTSVGIMIIVLGAACALAIFTISDVILSSYWRYVPAAIFVGLTYPSYSPGNHKWPTTLLCLVGILAVLKTRSRLRCGASGIAHGS